MSIFDKIKEKLNSKKDERSSNSSSPSPRRAGSFGAGGSGSSSGGGGPKIWSMPPQMRAEFEKGVRYNLKIVLRGMRRTGKSVLLARLHGRGVASDYAPSPEISAATIRAEIDGEGAKVDIWDVVDEGLPGTSSSSSSSSNSATARSGGIRSDGQEAHMPPEIADARSIDVYRSCNCVVFMIDVQRRQTLDYAVAHAPEVPPTAVVLLILNFIDTPKPWAVSEHDVDAAARAMRRSTTPLVLQAAGGAAGRVTDPQLSMGASWLAMSALTGRGVDAFSIFLRIPVAMAKLESLEAQMRAVYRDVEGHQAELLEMRARSSFEEKERERQAAAEAEARAAREAAQAAMPQPPTAKNRSAPAPPAAAPVAVISAATAPAAPQASSRPPHRPEETNPSKIDDSFFDDDDDDDDAANDRRLSSSSSSSSRGVAGREGQPGRGARFAPSQTSDREAESAAARVGAAILQKQPVAPPLPTPQPSLPPPQSAAPEPPAAEALAAIVADAGGAALDDNFFGDDSEDDAADDAAAGSASHVEKEVVPTSTPASASPVAPTTPSPISISGAGDEGSSLRRLDANVEEEEDAEALQRELAAARARRRAVGAMHSSSSTAPNAAAAPGSSSAAATAARPAPVAVDVQAIMAQMQAALVEGPQSSAPDVEGAGGQASRKEKKEKKEKKTKKDKKDKKGRDGGRGEAAGVHGMGAAEDDGGFDVIVE